MFDAIHLASALRPGADRGVALAFAVSDGTLLKTAAAEHLAVLDVEAPPPP